MAKQKTPVKKIKLTMMVTITYTPDPAHYPGANGDYQKMAEIDINNYLEEPVTFIDAMDDDPTFKVEIVD